MAKELKEKQKRKLAKIADVIQNGDLAIAEMIFDLEDRLDADLPALHDLMKRLKGDKGDPYQFSKKDIQEIASVAQKLVNINTLASAAASLVHIPIEKIVKEAVRLIPAGKDGKTYTKEELEKIIKPLIPEPIAGEDGMDADTEEVFQKIIRDLPSIGTYWRDGLELLQGAERLDISAIDGIEELKQEILETAKGYRVIGGQQGLRMFISGVKLGLIQSLNIVAGTGMTIVYSKLNGQDTVTFSSTGSAGGFTELVATGTVNSVNTSFTFTAVPSYIVADGVWFKATNKNGSVNWTNVGLTITMVNAPAFDIFGVA